MIDAQVLLAFAPQAPVTITDERTVGASRRGPGWQLGAWIALAAAFTAVGVYWSTAG